MNTCQYGRWKGCLIAAYWRGWFRGGQETATWQVQRRIWLAPRGGHQRPQGSLQETERDCRVKTHARWRRSRHVRLGTRSGRGTWRVMPSGLVAGTRVHHVMMEM